MKAIVAMDPQRVIGYRGGIPWHYKDDMAWFKAYTMNKTLIMGWKTYQSLPVFLKGRQICVISNKCEVSDLFRPVLKADNVFFRYPPNRQDPWVMDVFDPADWDDAVVAGGAKTYSMLMPHISEMYVTHIADEYEGDTYMPPFEHLFPTREIVLENKDFIIAR